MYSVRFNNISKFLVNACADTNKTVQKKYLDMDQGERVQCMYIWIGGNGDDMRGKTKTVESVPKVPSDLPIWNYDGSSTKQAEGHESDVYIYPVAIYKDPFRGGNNKLVLCDTYDKNRAPLPSNKRKSCLEVMTTAKVKESKPWFGIEQEFTLLDVDGHPYGWPKNGYPGPQGPYHCGVGTNRSYARDVVEGAYKACLYAGITVSGSNAESMPDQWELQCGPCEGISMGDELWVMRYLLHRVGEDYNIVVSLDPKPVTGDWNGAGCHTNYSTKSMREHGGMKDIMAAIEKLSKSHLKHQMLYDPRGGEDNKRRLTGRHETASYADFSYGIAHRGTSIRIPRQCSEDGCGYLEDRRPSSNCDPYTVTEAIVRTTILNV